MSLCALSLVFGLSAQNTLLNIEREESKVYQTVAFVLDERLKIADCPKDSAKRACDSLSFWYDSDLPLEYYSDDEQVIICRTWAATEHGAQKQLTWLNHHLSLNDEVYLVSNFSGKTTEVEKISDEWLEHKYIGDLPARDFDEKFNQDYSMSLIDTAEETENAVRVFFNGIAAEDLPTYYLLSQILNQGGSSFQKNLVNSGLALDAQLTYHPMRAQEFLYFQIRPNPLGIQQSIEAFFQELYAMPWFDYTSKEQLELAKKQAAIEREWENDDFLSEAMSLAALHKNGFVLGSNTFLDSVQSVTKFDIMRFIKKYLHEQPFLLQAKVVEDKLKEVSDFMYNLKPIENYEIAFDDKKDHKLDNEMILKLQEIAYLMNLSPWAEFEIEISGSGRKKHKKKRRDELEAYFKAKQVGNELSFTIKRNFRIGENETESVEFRIKPNE